MLDKQSQYNQAIDNMTYLVFHYPKPVQELLAKHHVFFQGKPTRTQLINEVVERLKANDSAFSNALERLFAQAASQDNDMFFGTLAKGAVGLIGGLFKKKKRSRSNRGGNSAALQARMAAQASAAKRDMEMRMQRMREEEERRRREAEERQRREQERQRRDAEAKKKTNMMFIIGGGVAILGLGAVLLMKSNRPPMNYGPSPIQMPRH